MDERFQWIELKKACHNNLKGISLKIPRNRFVVITGVSGSGKSSLAFDVIHAEGRRKYLENLNTQARKLSGKLEKPDIEEIKNLTPTLALSQSAPDNNPRSTVGTLSEIYDYLRLLFARLGKTEIAELELNQSLFSFNTPAGACPQCKGLGVEDRIDPKLLIDDQNKSIRERAFKITNPKGYIIYSQVTIDALNEVCQAHGFSVDIPWNKLTQNQQNIVLYGSDIIKIPYGKHTLESRMRWSGITAKPREEGYYKGIIPVMDQILQRDRNPNILRFARVQTCKSCEGSRLSDAARSVFIQNFRINDLASLNLDELQIQLNSLQFNDLQKEVAEKITAAMSSRINVLSDLGLGYLSCNRQVDTLSGGELQRIRLARLINSKLRNITFIFDEPSVGVHPANNSKLIGILRQLVNNGNTVLVVEHDTETILQADWIIEIGPKAGIAGGELIFNGSTEEFLNSTHPSLTRSYLQKELILTLPYHPKDKKGFFQLQNAVINNLKNISPKFALNRLNVVTGISGAGKSSLIKQTLVPMAQGRYFEQINAKGEPKLIDFPFKQIIFVDRSPIGKNARSTPSTYTKLQDQIRDIYAATSEAKKTKLSKSAFSFNAAEGRCQNCEGAGKIEVRMHFLGNIESTCPVCEGKRYNEIVLQVKYHGKNISEVLEMSVDEALEFFNDDPKLKHGLDILQSIGLGYVKLGQSSGSLSGGEAQRIKLATEIIRGGNGPVLFIFDEPSTGLHYYDIQVLLNLFSRLLDQGNTLLLIEHHSDIIKNSHYVVDMGSNEGTKGGEIIFEGKPEDLKKCSHSLTGQSLDKSFSGSGKTGFIQSPDQISFTGIETNNLKQIDVQIADNLHTVITGKSGSGKSSLAFDTIFTEAQNRFTESFPAYIRRFTTSFSTAKFATVSGLTPALALRQGQHISDPRSTLGTLTEISDNYRLLFARFGTIICKKCGNNCMNDPCPACGTFSEKPGHASGFSFNNSDAACPECSGLGKILTSTPDLLIAFPDRSFAEGALHPHKSLQFYTDPFGQYISTLKQVGRENGIDYNNTINQLSEEAIKFAFYGTGEKTYDVEWNYNRKGREGQHHFAGTWKGFIALLLDEYYRKHANGKGNDLLVYLTEKPCHFCNGQRFKSNVLAVKFAGYSIFEIGELTIRQSRDLFRQIMETPEKFGLSEDFGNQQNQILQRIEAQFDGLIQLGLEYLHINRQSGSLSGGELQRTLLSSHLKGGLCGLTYVLDEPSTGLHPADVQKLNVSIRKLVDAGNTVITVEHNPEIIDQADRLLELGPGAGKDGGKLIRDSIPDKEIYFLKTKQSLFNPKSGAPLNWIRIEEAFAHNLKHISPSFRFGVLNVVCGVSGSGKTSLLRDVLVPSFNVKQARNCKSIQGLEFIKGLKWIDKKSLAGNVNSTPATFTGIFNEIRKLLAKTKTAKEKGLTNGDFSFNSKSGQCPVCKGQGSVTVKLDFMPDVETPCDACHGQRYKNHILEVKFQNKNVHEILTSSVDEALLFFKNEKSVAKSLSILSQLGLGYLTMGQSASSLSGGEAQRLKIAREIIESTFQNTVYIFDEPSRGLHPTDIKYLLQLFQLLLEKGNTVIAIEHNPLIIVEAAHVVDLGPGGEDGGKLLFEGSPAQLTRHTQSITGRYLKKTGLV